MADPDLGYQGLSTGQILIPTYLPELKQNYQKESPVFTPHNKALSLLVSAFLRITTYKITGVFTEAEGSIVQSVITLGIYSSNHYSAFLSHAAFFPSPGESVIYRGSITLNPNRSLYFVNSFGTSPGQM